MYLYSTHLAALNFSLLGTILENVRGVDDEFNVIPSAAITGALFSISKGSRAMLKTSLVGTVLSVAYIAFTKRDALLPQLPNLSSMSSNNNKHY